MADIPHICKCAIFQLRKYFFPCEIESLQMEIRANFTLNFSAAQVRKKKIID